MECLYLAPLLFIGIFTIEKMSRDIHAIRVRLCGEEQVEPSQTSHNKRKPKLPRRCDKCDLYSSCDAPGLGSEECCNKLRQLSAVREHVRMT
jgi:hypothetical protein